MSPRLSRKRHAASPDPPPAKRHATTVKKEHKSGKQTLFDAIDTKKSAGSTPEQTKAYLDSLQDSEGSELSDVDSDDFEDVPINKKRKTDHGNAAHDSQGEEQDDDEMDWEDAIQPDPTPALAGPGTSDDDIGDVSISFNEDGTRVLAGKDLAASTVKKGPSKRERMVRNGTHCIHVQALMWHNAMRNSWLNDKELQKILVDGLNEGVLQEVDRWREDMGLPLLERPGRNAKSRGKGKKSARKSKDATKRDGRDWGLDADKLEKGAINMSKGDPLLRLLKVLTAYWRKRFSITAPALRKQGYMSLKRLTGEVNAWKESKNDAERHGERIENVQELRKLAKTCEGSRDVGAQLFVALLRGLGIETRLVANLQPAGIGWGKIEEAHPPKSAKSIAKAEEEGVEDGKPKKKPSKGRKKTKAELKAALTPQANRKSERSNKTEVINLDSEEEASALSSVPSDFEDDTSIIDVTPNPSKKPKKKYDRDLHFPHYWAEVLSSISNQYIPVDPIILSTVATNGELLATFEPRGKASDQAKQVMCYTIAHSPDGSAKDVTVRYLRKHQLPGRTKGYRMPVEKVKVYNKRGKVRKYEDYDWFKTVMSNFERPHAKRTPADDLEDATDLKPYKPTNDKPQAEVESLQWYKQSAEFVLERHLRREEAIIPGAKQVKTFRSGKGDKETEDPVYLRKDVVPCKTAESWHKEGREIKIGQQPMKLVPMRAVTTMRKREIEEIERETGEKAKQGLFARDQTDWIIPPPIGSDRQIPRNAFGNIDVYVPSMVPKGAIHIPLKGTARICRDLNISHAEACTGFEFGKRMAIPVLTGVVVAEEHEDAVIDAWQEREVERKRKEDVKKEAMVLHLWRKFVMGMRIVERMRSEYADAGGKGEEVNPFVNRAKQKKMTDEGVDEADHKLKHEDFAAAAMGGGGFVVSDEEKEDHRDDGPRPKILVNAEEDMDMDLGGGGGFMIEDDEEEETESTANKLNGPAVTPMSLSSAHNKIKKGQHFLNVQDQDEDEDDQISDEPQPKGSTKTSAKRKTPAKKTTTKPAVKKQTPTSASKRQSGRNTTKAKKSAPLDTEDELEEDELSALTSDLDDDDDDDDDDDVDNTDATTPPAKKTRATQPRSRPDKPVARNADKGKGMGLRSPYFGRSEAGDVDGDNDDGDGDGDEDKDEVEEDEDEDEDENGQDEEVVKPRMTTARTRARAKVKAT